MGSKQKLLRADLWSLEDYSERRPEFRREVIAHKKQRQVRLGDHATLYFEDALTMRYQIQEMLRVEKIFTAAEIEEELEAYNPLIPDGSNWKATFMIEYADEAERRIALSKLSGIEHKVWVMPEGHDKRYAIANEDLERSTEDKAAAVHFMRFEFDADWISAVKSGAAVKMGINHPEMPYETDVSQPTLQALAQDFD